MKKLNSRLKLSKKGKLFLVGGLGLLLFLIILIVCLFLFRGSSGDPVKMTEKFMNSYIHLNDDVISKVKYEFDDELNSSQRKTYLDIMKRQYSKIDYQIKDSVINEGDAIITVEFSVYDYNAGISKANNYISIHEDEFLVDKKFDNEKAVSYKLDSLKGYNERVTYTIMFNYYKEGKKWILNDLADSDLKKLNGTF